MPNTDFRPEVHGFAFANYWKYDKTEESEVHKAFKDSVDATRAFLSVMPGGPLLWFALRDIRAQLATWLREMIVEAYGMCGGMAFAALDYYHAGSELPRGVQRGVPTHNTAEGGQLRDYIRRRLVDSLNLNGAIFLAWMAVLHRVSDRGPFRGGPGWLRAESEKQWKTLKKHLDAGRPWPIGLVGTTQEPSSNHQVLAYGYEDPGDGTGTIYVYDMNCPGKQIIIGVDFRGQTLEAKEGCSSKARGPLQGFFCEIYLPEPNPPPISWP